LIVQPSFPGRFWNRKSLVTAAFTGSKGAISDNFGGTIASSAGTRASGETSKRITSAVRPLPKVFISRTRVPGA
jgi:hypothetical protein